jgi:cell division protease FtsH
MIASNHQAPGAAVGGPPEAADLVRLARRGLRGVLRAARADLTPTLGSQVVAHLGSVPADVGVVEESWAAYEHVNVQAGLDAWLAEPGREHRLVGVTGHQHHEVRLADLLSGGSEGAPWGPRPGNVATVNVACGPDGQVRPCVACGIYLVTEPTGERLVLLLRGPERDLGRGNVSVEAIGTEPGPAAVAAARIRELTREHNVFRGQVLSFGGDFFDSGPGVLQFHRRARLERSGLVLPAGLLEAVERQVVGVGRHRAALLASGQHLKRGLLLFGPPGTGKTHTVRYLVASGPDVTVVQLTGPALGLIAEACSIARALTPSMVVVEDVDLIAEDRDSYHGQGSLLFQLLNEMDGLAEDADVVFVLTTNRADLLEPALAARPGRVDQAVELQLPDEAARRALLELYRGTLVVPGPELDAMAAATDGVTASFLKELLRRAALIAADGAAADGAAAALSTDEAVPLTVDGSHLRAALSELQDTRNAMTRAVLGGRSTIGARPPGGTGFQSMEPSSD